MGLEQTSITITDPKNKIKSKGSLFEGNQIYYLLFFYFYNLNK